MPKPPRAPTSPQAARSPGGARSAARSQRTEEPVEWNGPLDEIRVNLRRGMLREITLLLMDLRPRFRDRGHLIRTLLGEALEARRLRLICAHTWVGGTCSRCSKSQTDVQRAPGAELLLRFASLQDADVFKADPAARQRLLERADWQQGAIVPIAA